MKSPIDKTVEMSKLLSKNHCDWVRVLLTTAISQLDNEEHKRLYKSLKLNKNENNQRKSS